MCNVCSVRYVQLTAGYKHSNFVQSQQMNQQCVLINFFCPYFTFVCFLEINQFVVKSEINRPKIISPFSRRNLSGQSTPSGMQTPRKTSMEPPPVPPGRKSRGSTPNNQREPFRL